MNGKRFVKNGRKILLVLTSMLSVFLLSCGISGASQKAVDEGKVAIVSKEYEKARDLFKLAVDEDSKNSEAKSLLDLSNDYIELMATITTGEFDKADELIANIENNEKLEIIKEDFEKTKNNINESKDMVAKYSDEIASIEKLLEDGNVDESKSSAITKLEEVKGIKVLEDRLNSVIKKADEKIANVKAEILKYATDINGIDNSIIYKGMITFDDNSGVFAEVEELKGKTMYRFYENRDLSPRQYVYNENTGDVFMLNQGMVIWINNGDIYVNEPQPIVNESVSEGKISKKEAEEIGINYYFNTYSVPISERKWFFATASDDADDNDEYFCRIDQALGDPFAIYYINANTGDVRVESQRY